MIPFIKYHALGNDYLVMDPHPLSTELQRLILTPQWIRNICHRHYGLGADGILWGPLWSPSLLPQVRIFNPDGSEAEKSGNGIRIFARFLKEKYQIDRRFRLETLGGPVQVEFLDQHFQKIRVNMGIPQFESHQIPVLGAQRLILQEPLELACGTYQITCLSIGNPHCVIAIDDLCAEKAKQLGPLVENHPLFPQRINLQLLKVMDRKNLQIEIWERGAGYTLASGSSSCAAACAAHRLGWVDPTVTVHMPGGRLFIEHHEDQSVSLTGPVTRIAEGKLDLQTFESLNDNHQI